MRVPALLPVIGSPFPVNTSFHSPESTDAMWCCRSDGGCEASKKGSQAVVLVGIDDGDPSATLGRCWRPVVAGLGDFQRRSQAETVRIPAWLGWAIRWVVWWSGQTPRAASGREWQGVQSR